MEVSKADILIVIGTSMAVYPAAGLVNYAGDKILKYIVDPNIPDDITLPNLIKIPKKASKGVPELVKRLTYKS